MVIFLFFLLLVLVMASYTGLFVGGLLVLAVAYYFLYLRGTKQNYEKVVLVDPAIVTPPLKDITYALEDPVPVQSADILEYADDADPTHHAGYARLSTEKKETAVDRMKADAEASSISRSAAAATPFNVDVANPASWNFTAGVPRTTIMDRRKLDADPFRGDIPIVPITGFANPVGSIVASTI